MVLSEWICSAFYPNETLHRLLPCVHPDNIVDMKAQNYDVTDASETITFKGVVARSTSQAFFLTFCTALALASLALVLQIQFIDLGESVI